MNRTDGGRQARRTFPARYKEKLVQAYELAVQVSPSAADALLRAENVPLSYVNRWRDEMQSINVASPMCDGCRGSLRFPRAVVQHNKRNRSS